MPGPLEASFLPPGLDVFSLLCAVCLCFRVFPTSNKASMMSRLVVVVARRAGIISDFIVAIWLQPACRTPSARADRSGPVLSRSSTPTSFLQGCHVQDRNLHLSRHLTQQPTLALLSRRIRAAALAYQRRCCRPAAPLELQVPAHRCCIAGRSGALATRRFFTSHRTCHKAL